MLRKENRKVYIPKYYLNNMNNIINNPTNFTKKISLNMNTNILNLVKDIAKLTKTTNTLVIEALLVKGISPLMKQFKDSWTAVFYNIKDKNKKENLTRLLKELKKISEKEEYKPLIEG